jgi:hypothetical protein
VTQLQEKPAEGGDLDGRVITAYLNQCTAEAQVGYRGTGFGPMSTVGIVVWLRLVPEGVPVPGKLRNSSIQIIKSSKTVPVSLMINKDPSTV